MQHYSSQAFTDIGKPAGGATITVKLAGSNTNATIYSDDGVTVKSNPFVTNNLGQFDFYAASGKYDITVTGTQITTYTLPNQVVFDPFEANAADSTTFFGTPINTAGVGGFWTPTVTYPAMAGTSSVIVGNANEVRVFQFVLNFSVTVGRLALNISIAANGTGDVGIYSSSGVRLIYTGGFSTASTGYKSIATVGGPIVLSPSVYYAAQTCSSAVAYTTTVGNLGPTNIYNAAVVRGGIAANGASGGVLPAAMGAITADSSVAAALVFYER